jgi:hypothetical protein
MAEVAFEVLFWAVNGGLIFFVLLGAILRHWP